MKKNFFLLFLLNSITLMLFTNNFNFFGGGVGSKDSPFLIENIYHLNNIRYFPDKHFKQVSDIDFSDKEKWIPIGIFNYLGCSENYFFSGSYDGNGYEILNLKIIEPDKSFIGLFSVITSEALIKNITLKNILVEGREVIGGLVGINYGRIENCYVSGKIKGFFEVGGLVGWNSNIVIDSFSEAHVEGIENFDCLIGLNDCF